MPRLHLVGTPWPVPPAVSTFPPQIQIHRNVCIALLALENHHVGGGGFPWPILSTAVAAAAKASAMGTHVNSDVTSKDTNLLQRTGTSAILDIRSAVFFREHPDIWLRAWVNVFPSFLERRWGAEPVPFIIGLAGFNRLCCFMLPRAKGMRGDSSSSHLSLRPSSVLDKILLASLLNFIDRFVASDLLVLR